MDIKNLTTGVPTGRSNEVNKPLERGQGQQTSASNQAELTDRVTLTDALSQVQNLEIKSQSVKVDNSARIAELKAAIADGSYQVDSKRVADQLMKTEALFSKV